MSISDIKEDIASSIEPGEQVIIDPFVFKKLHFAKEIIDKAPEEQVAEPSDVLIRQFDFKSIDFARASVQNTPKVGKEIMQIKYSRLPNKRAACLFVWEKIFLPSRPIRK